VLVVVPYHVPAEEVFDFYLLEACLSGEHGARARHLAYLYIELVASLDDRTQRGLVLTNETRDEAGRAFARTTTTYASRHLDAALSGLIDRTKFAYVPLEYYDVDRQIARMLPDNLTLGRLFLPFDLISRTIMVACCNPFDATGRDAVQQSLDYTVTWYLARPGAIVKALQDVYRLESRA